MGKVNYLKRWVGQDLDDEFTRKRFIRHLKRWHNEFTTPWWDCGFNRWLVYAIYVNEDPAEAGRFCGRFTLKHDETT